MNLLGRLSASLDALSGRSSQPAVIENALDNDGEGWSSFWDAVSASSTGVAGIKVSERTMLKVAAVRQAIQTISGDIACSTLQLHKNDIEPGEDSVQRAHPTHHVTAIRWSRYQSAFECWKRIVVHALLWGNGYAYIKRDSRGRVMWMANLAPGTCMPCFETINDEEVAGYRLQIDTSMPPMFVVQNEVFHLPGLSIEADEAEDVVTYMRDTISVALGAQKFEGSFFANGAQSGGIITVPPGTPTQARERLEQQIQKKATAENWFKTMVLRDGAQWHSTTVDARSSEMTAIMEAVVRDVARFFNLPPFKLGLVDSVSYNSSEQGQRVYLTGCLNHWLKAIACEAHLKLLPSVEQVSGRYRFEHNVSKLVEPDFMTLNEVLALQRQNEIINANEFRAKINLSPRADKEALKYVNPNTKSNVSSDSPKPESPDTEDDTETDEDYPAEQNTARVVRTRPRSQAEDRLLAEAVQRATKRICIPLRNRAKRPDTFAEWLDEEDCQNRSLIHEELGATLSLVYGDDAGNRLQAIEQVFFDSLTSAVAIYAEPPYTETALHTNVTQACDQFSQTIYSTLAGSFDEVPVLQET